MKKKQNKYIIKKLNKSNKKIQNIEKIMKLSKSIFVN